MGTYRSVILYLLVIPGCFAQAQRRDNFADIRKRIDSAIQNNVIPSVSISVARDGKIIWEEAFGWSDKEKNVRATIQTRYPIASVSKPMTTTAVMILKQRGQVSLDMPIENYLAPGVTLSHHFKEDGPVTLKYVMQHRAGFPLLGQQFYTDENKPIPKLPEYINRYGIVVNPVNERYIYSNIGYGVLAHVVENVSGMPLQDFLRREIFLPLGMKHSSLETSLSLSMPAATVYDGNNNPLARIINPESGSGSVISTAHDMVLFGLFHIKQRLPHQKKILTDNIIDEMVGTSHTTGTAGGRYGTDWFYALGWGGREKSPYGYRWYGHEGGMPGTSAQLKIIPEGNIVIAVVSNKRASFTYGLVDEIENALLPDWPALKASDPSKKRVVSNYIYSTPPEFIGDWEGEIATYSGTLPVRAQFRNDSDLVIQINNGLKTLLNNPEYIDGRFTADYFGTIPTEDASKYPTELWMEVTYRNGKLNGYVSAVATDPRRHFYLPYWIELRKKVRTGKLE